LHGKLTVDKQQQFISTFIVLKRRLTSSPYFVRYLATINHRSCRGKYFIVYKPIKLADPHISAYRTIRHFLPFIKLEREQMKNQ
jgi:hypothetical protein